MARHDNSRPLPPTAYFRYQGAIVNEMKKRGVQVMLPNASRWISSRWRDEDPEIKKAFWQLAAIREAEDKEKTAEDKALMKRARRKRGGVDDGPDVLLEGSTNPEARQLANVISTWVATIPRPSPQELEKQMMPVNLRRKGKKGIGSSKFVAGPSNEILVASSSKVVVGPSNEMLEAESDEDVGTGRLELDGPAVYETFYSVIASNQLMFE
jgi:hypothetical protein